jgi:hypothetical protein
LLKADDVVFIGRPDIAVASTTGASIGAALSATTSVTVLEVDVPMQDEVSENFLEIYEVSTTVRNRPPQTVPEICSTPAARPSPILRCVASPSTSSAAPLQPWLQEARRGSRPALGAGVPNPGERIAGGWR